MEKKSVKKKRKTSKRQHSDNIELLLSLYDVIAVNVAYFLALWMRFDFHFSEIPAQYLDAFLYFAPIYSLICLIVFRITKLYQSIWRFVSFKELTNTLIATFITCTIQTILMTLIQRMPLSYYIIGALLQFIFILGIRFSYRFYLLISKDREREEKEKKTSVMLIGAGNAGHMILRDINKEPKSKDQVVCIIDDNMNKWGRSMDGVLVVGGRDDILAAVDKYNIEKIYIAIPSATPQQMRDIINICKETGCQLKNLPSIYQLVSGEITVSRMKDVAIEDLLGRDPIKIDLSEVFNFIHDKTIMVTGGGGSIGSELARQIASHSPKQLILFDIYENNIYAIQQELKRKYGNSLDLVCLIGSVQDSKRIYKVMQDYRPDIVFHAAAHKHVPLMEDSPCEAIKNNAIGTYKTAYAAISSGVQKFVLISTDKAVNPTNIMGATKRMCEMVIQTFDANVKAGTVGDMPQITEHGESFPKPEHPVTQFAAVRFGNVLGSNGSVIPLFKKQLAEGGPLTVTHPDIIRYFMTIPEAVSLVLQAGYYGRGGEIFVLDMGDPVKIDDLARNLIKLSGLKPDVDIKIQYVGLRPGEKLYEEKLMAEEGLEKTANNLIHIGKPIAFDHHEFLDDLQTIIKDAYANDEDETINMVLKIVTTYQPNENV